MYFLPKAVIFILCLLTFFYEPLEAQIYNWTQQGPHAWTEGRAKHATATIADNKILLFGGVSLGIYAGDLQDTWIYDVDTDGWDSQSPLSSPSPRSCHAMAYIGEDKVILYGGLQNNDTHFDDTWIYDLSDNSWTLMNPPVYPTARCNHKLVNIGEDQVLLFGGYHGWDNYNDETWIYDLSDNAWTQQNPSTKPPERAAYAMTYVGDDQVILFSGAIYNNTDGYPVYNNETWIYDVSDNEWTKKSPNTVPAMRIYHDMVFIGGDQALLFGGFGPDRETGNTLNDTWIYDLSADLWKEISFGNPEPTAVLGHSMSSTSFDGTGSIALFLGSRNRAWDDFSKETWLLDWQSASITFTNNPPVALNVECDTSTEPEDTGGSLTGTTNCILGGLVIAYSDQITSGPCTNEYTITRTWTASDNCGITDTYIQTINIYDNTGPIIDCSTISSDTILYVGGSSETAYLPDYTMQVTAIDNCDGTILVSQIPTGGNLLGVGNHIITFNASDACGNVSSTCNQLVVVRDSNPLTLTMQDFPKYFNKNNHTIEVRVDVEPNFGLEKVICDYKGIAMSEDQISTKDLSFIIDNTFSMIFQDVDFDEQGLEFHIVAYDLDGNYISSGAQYIYNEYDETNAPRLDNLRFGSETEKYEIIAIPFHSINSNLSINGIFEDEFGHYGDTEIWRLWRYINDDVENVEYGKPGFQDSYFQVGKGYWLIIKNDITIDIGPSNTIEFNQGNPYPITLDHGYNQIGNPYDFAIEWSDVIEYNRDFIGSLIDDIDNDIKIWKGNWNDPSNIIPAGRGAFVYNNNNQSVTIYMPALKNPELSSGRTQSDEFLTKRNWISENGFEWVISLNLELENQSYTLGGLGMHNEAELGYDKYDDITPPHFMNYLEIYSIDAKHSWGRKTKDIIPVQDTGRWDFVIDQNLNSRNLMLSWDRSKVRNLNKGLALYDPGNGQLYDMSKEQNIMIKLKSNAKSSIRFLYGDMAFIENNMMPDRLIVGDPYPNPFGENIFIPIHLPAHLNQPLSGSIFDISGKKIKTFSQKMDAGLKQIVQWDGKDDSGSEISPGMYIIQLRNESGGLNIKKVFKK